MKINGSWVSVLREERLEMNAYVSIVYHSGTGHTQKMAEAVQTGAASVENVQTNLIAIEGKDIAEGRWKNDDIMQTLEGSDAIIFGSPTYMGCVSGQMKSFLDATVEPYFSRTWVDKVASGFSVSGVPSGDKLNTLMTFATCAMQLGMIWVGLKETPFNDNGINRLSFYFGAAGQALEEPLEEAPNAQDKDTGKLLGIRVAKITKIFTT